MFDLPGLESVGNIFQSAGAAVPGLGALGAGMGAGGAVADAASSAWDFGANALSNFGSLGPLIGGPFMPSFGGGSGGAPGNIESVSGDLEMPLMTGVPDLVHGGY